MESVYQMVIAPNPDGELGLMFASELINQNDDGGNIASPSLMVFALPITDPLRRDKVLHSEYSFPALRAGEIAKYTLRYNSDIDSMEVPGFNLNNGTQNVPISLRFQFLFLPPRIEELDHYNDRAYRGRAFYDTNPFEYFGSSNIISKGQLFLPIIPIDIILMDILYFQKKICLVGRTPTFNTNAEG